MCASTDHHSLYNSADVQAADSHLQARLRGHASVETGVISLDRELEPGYTDVWEIWIL